MALGKRRNEFLQSAKYDARYGRLYTQDRVMANGRWEVEQKDVADNFRAVFDMHNLQKGWIEFPSSYQWGLSTMPASLPTTISRKACAFL